MQFALIARDGTDAEALERRLAVRAQHLEEAKSLHAKGNILTAAVMLDERAQMAGSIMLCDFPDRDALDAWLKHEIYMTADVWKEVEIIPIKVASLAP